MAPLVQEWRIQREWTTSDHHSIEIRLSLYNNRDNNNADKQHQEPTKQRFNVKTADWDKFKETLTRKSTEELNSVVINTEGDVEEMAVKLTEVITYSCEESPPAVRESSPGCLCLNCAMRQRECACVCVCLYGYLHDEKRPGALASTAARRQCCTSPRLPVPIQNFLKTPISR